MEITKITLLTSSEQAQYNKYIPKIDEVWWLKSEGCDHTVQIAHNGITTAIRPSLKRYVRPVLHLKGVTASPGDELTIFAYKWTVLSNDNCIIAICNTPVTYRSFDDEDRNWQHSDLRNWLHRWLRKRQKTNNCRVHKRYKCMNTFGMRCTESKFIMEFILPLCVALISSGIICPLSFLTKYQVPVFVTNTLLAIAAAVCAMEILYLCFILMSPHKDTSLMLGGLILGTVLAIHCAQWLPSFPALIFTSAIIAINCICARYLRMIKYYS